MKLENMRETSFPLSTLTDWADKATESLKGKSIESLSNSTYEGIQLKPLYTKEDIDTFSLSQYPGGTNFSRGIDARGYTGKSWHVANKKPYRNLEQLAEKLNIALTTGQTALAFDVKAELFSDNDKLAKWLGDVTSQGPFSVDAKEYLKPFLAEVIGATKENKSEVTGFIAADFIATAAGKGNFHEEDMNDWLEAIKLADQELPNVKTILIDSSVYHNSGASAVQELGISIATGVFYVQKLLDHGLSLDEILKKTIFHYSIGSNFFMETAKLRAARILWDKAMEAYEANEESRKMVISAETSQFTKTVFDPYVNLLRAGNEAFAAVLGGVQYLSVTALDEVAGKTSSFSERIARNTQLILKSEAHLEKVTDPAGGSWYVETLTHELAEKAWSFFLEIDEQGGILEVLKSNWLQNDLAKTRAKREEDLYLRKQSMIGTNVYANVTEQMDSIDVKSYSPSSSSTMFLPLENKRLAEPYEFLRYRALEIERNTGEKPAIGLIGLGDLKKRKPRVDFMTSFLASGGIEAKKSEDIHDSQAAIQFIKETGLKHYCLCGDNYQYEEQGLNLVKELAVKLPELQLSLAGLPDEVTRTALSQAGIKQYYHVKSNNYEALSNLLNEMGVPAR
ncbi:heterodimeric methylmalonyl-CoA mutase small subunit [Mesobacillus persicus]|uniref:Heterodimeric methylmalonyl-CoA mutase small subunit n=1 Tax=Mesobacillus persicus TaxID=930146 RepID=A0A1H8C0S6_9BACI|nr:methylmalonyl-CoA mutase family protein [Mesobacillus persicus]SEM88024.1 heterodimeric methylmalonyl-CoA mutase small subunit [Mesobacillus persicus]